MNIHATAIAINASGILIEGPSGSGKSSLALAAIKEFQASGRFATLVADDQCLVEAANGRLIAHCPPPLRGLAETRGLGITAHPFLKAVVIDFGVRLIPAGLTDRMPDAKTTTIAGVEMPIFELPARQIVIALVLLDQIIKNRRV